MPSRSSPTPNDTYALLDSGHGRKLEQFGPYTLIRPAAQALWKPSHPSLWDKASASFSRDKGNVWHTHTRLPESWDISLDTLRFKIAPTDFGHLGIFPEHSTLWGKIRSLIRQSPTPVRVLNLFAYSGGATLAAAQAGAQVCHLDASKGMVAWARENAALSNLSQAPIRWIVDDVFKFLQRESKRNSLYHGIILDPPSFGRGSHGEVFKIEEQILDLLSLCRSLLADSPLFFFLTSHTQGVSPLVLQHLLTQTLPPGHLSCGELIIPSPTYPLPSGSFATWEKNTQNPKTKIYD